MRFSCNFIIQSSDVVAVAFSLLGISCNDPTDLHLIRTTVIDNVISTVYWLVSAAVRCGADNLRHNLHHPPGGFSVSRDELFAAP